MQSDDLDQLLSELDDVQWTKEDVADSSVCPRESAGDGETGEPGVSSGPGPSPVKTAAYPAGRGRHEAPGPEEDSEEEQPPAGDAGDDLTADLPVRKPRSGRSDSGRRTVYDREKEEKDAPEEEQEGEQEIRKEEKQPPLQEVPKAPPRPRVVVAEPAPPTPPPQVVVQPTASYEPAPAPRKRGTGTGLKWLLAFLLTAAVLLGGYLLFREFLQEPPEGSRPSPNPGGDVLTVTVPPMNTYTPPPTSPPKSIYSITVTAGSGGSVTPSGSVDVEEGGSVNFIITPDAGYEISQLLIDGTSTEVQSAYTFDNVSRNHTLYAVFQALASAPPTEIPMTNTPVPTAEPTTEPATAEPDAGPVTPEPAPPMEESSGQPEEFWGG